MTPLVKICGLNSVEALDAALSAGADLVGFVRYPRSPRHLGLDEAGTLSGRAKGKALRVALTVDASDEELSNIVAAIDPDVLQLHGDEAPGRVAAIRARFGRPVMKAVGIADESDLAALVPLRRGRRPAAPRRQAAEERRGAARRQRPRLRLAARRRA